MCPLTSDVSWSRKSEIKGLSHCHGSKKHSVCNVLLSVTPVMSNMSKVYEMDLEAALIMCYLNGNCPST